MFMSWGLAMGIHRVCIGQVDSQSNDFQEYIHRGILETINVASLTYLIKLVNMLPNLALPAVCSFFNPFSITLQSNFKKPSSVDFCSSSNRLSKVRSYFWLCLAYGVNYCFW